MRFAGGLCLLLCAAAIAAAGCGSGGDDSISPDAIAQAATVTGNVQGANAAIQVTMKAPSLGKRTLSFSGNGVEDIRAQAGHFNFDMRQLAEQSGGQLDPAKAKLEGIYTNHTIYMRSPLFEGQLPKGKKWLGLNLAKALQQKGVDPSLLSQQNDPAQYLRYLEATSGKVTKEGTERVRGVPTTHYKATVDLHRLPKAQGASAQRLIALTGTSKIPTEVWIDSKHLVRRLKVDVSTKLPNGPAAGQRLEMQETIDLFAFGPKPKVEPPPAGQVFDATNLAAQQPTR